MQRQFYTHIYNLQILLHSIYFPLKIHFFKVSREMRWWSANTLFLGSETEVTQLCPTLVDPMDCSLPGSCIHGIFQARVLEWVAISFSRVSSWPMDRIQVSHIAGRHFIIWATREALFLGALVDSYNTKRAEAFRLGFAYIQTRICLLRRPLLGTR